MYKPRESTVIPDETVRIARACFPKGNAYMRLRDELGPLYEDQRFAELFSSVGQPGVAPGLLALVSVFQFMEGLSDRQAAEAVRGRIDWKYALGLEITDTGFDFSLLSEFRDRLLAGGLEQAFLDELLQVCLTQGLLKKRGKQRSDSTHVLGAVRVLNRLALLGETLRYALNTLARLEPAWLQQHVPPAWFEHYAVRFEATKLPETEAQRKALALEIGQAGYTLLGWVYEATTPERLREAPAIESLRRIWIQQYSLEGAQVKLRESGNLPPGERFIQSPYDLEVRWSQKRQTTWTGYKVHLTETCDEALPALITNVVTTLATTPDGSTTETIHANLAAKGFLPEEHLVDAGYLDAELLVSSAETYHLDLLGPVATDTTWQGRTNTGFALANFQVQWAQQVAVCPQGKHSHLWAESHDRFHHPVIHVRFAAQDCTGCSMRALCTQAKKNPRALKLRPQPQHEALQKARQRQTTEAFKQRYKKRAGIEGTLSQGVRAFETRQTRYIGLAKTHLQQCLSAVAMNMVRLAHWFNGEVPATTRLSAFAALAPG